MLNSVQSMAKGVKTSGYKLILREEPKVSIADELLGKFETKKGENISADVKKLRGRGYGKY